MTKNVDIWRGWAYLAARDKDYSGVPGWIEHEAHPSCSNARSAWCRLLGMERERFALEKRERLPQEVMGLTYATYDDAANWIEQNAQHWASVLAWGDPAGGP